MTSIYNLRTLIRPRIMPPKPEAKPLAPVRTYEQDAALTRARARKRDGAMNLQAAKVSQEHGRRRAKGYAVSQEDRRQAFLALMPCRTVDIANALGLSRGYISDILASLSQDGLAAHVRKGSCCIWYRAGDASLPRVEAAE